VHTWVETHLDIAAIVLPKDDLKAVAAARSNWKQVAPQVARLTSASKLGAAVFGVVAGMVNSYAYEQDIMKHVADLLETKLTGEDIDSFKAKCEEVVNQYKQAGILAGKRTICLDLAGLEVSVVVMDPSQETLSSMLAVAACCITRDGPKFSQCALGCLRYGCHAAGFASWVTNVSHRI
jgi:hypothetical protein